MDWQGIWDTIVNFFTTNVWNIVYFLAVFIIGYIVIVIIIRTLKRVFKRRNAEPVLTNFTVTIVKYVLYLVWILWLIAIIGIEISGIVTAVSAVILAVGMALEDNIANLANGIIVVSTKMVKQGDYIEVDGVSGSVEAVNILFTTINTPDSKKIYIPNSKMTTNSLINYGANPSRRVDFTFGVAYESDVEKVKSIVLKVMASNSAIYQNPAPFCKLKTLNASSIDFFANCWCDSGEYWNVYYYVVENVFNEFKREGISIPYQQVEIRERKEEVVMPVIEKPLPKREAKAKTKQKKKSFNPEEDDFSEYLDDLKEENAEKKAKRKEKRAAKKAKKAQEKAQKAQEESKEETPEENK